MKKGILLTCLTLMSAITLAGCSCGKKDGTYSFSYIEYAEDGTTQQSNCQNTTKFNESTYCELVSELNYDITKYQLEDNKFIISVEGNEEPVVMYYKIVDDVFMLSETEDGEYTSTKIIRYKDKKIEVFFDYFTIVFEK